MDKRIYGLLGRTLGHSWSVPIHTALGCPDYQLLELEPEALSDFLWREDIGGLNVTIPYKKTVLPYCDVVDEEARDIGCVNTIVRRADGRLCAWNTDAVGFRWMVQRAGIDFQNRKVLVLGSGGASLTAQAQARKLGAREVIVISRSGPDNYDNLDRHADADLIVNTTPLGMYPNVGQAAVDLTVFPECQGVVDVVYNPRRTALLLQAEALGIPCTDGLPMLVAQAVAAEEHFFDRTIPDSTYETILSQLRRDTQNIVLIGMPGSGKTTVGQKLAKLTGRFLLDIDEIASIRVHSAISEIFARYGEEAFRTLEREEIARAGMESGKIIVTGGGAVKDPRNLPPLRQNGRIYQLDRALDVLPTAGRPLSQQTAPEILYAERAPLYAQFRDAVIDNNGSVDQTAAAIWRDFCEHSGD